MNTDFWTPESADLHKDADQMKRQASASEIHIEGRFIERSQRVARIKDYAVSLYTCSCQDFRFRRLPCKHMYRLAHEFGLFYLDIQQLTLPVPEEVSLCTDASESDYFEGFAWAVPRAFAPALAACRFEQGDMLYDSRLAYEGIWSEAERHIKHSLQIRYPERQTPESRKKSDGAFRENWKRSVSFILTDHRTRETRLVPTTQGQLYMLLWTGELGYLDEATNTPQVPLLASDMLKHLNIEQIAAGVVEYFGEPANFFSRPPVLFLMPYDETHDALRIKLLEVKYALLRMFSVNVSIRAPALFGPLALQSWAPTVRLAGLQIANGVKPVVEQLLKSVLYRPAPDRKTDVDCFRPNRHGLLHAFDLQCGIAAGGESPLTPPVKPLQ